MFTVKAYYDAKSPFHTKEGLIQETFEAETYQVRRGSDHDEVVMEGRTLMVMEGVFEKVIIENRYGKTTDIIRKYPEQKQVMD